MRKCCSQKNKYSYCYALHAFKNLAVGGGGKWSVLHFGHFGPGWRAHGINKKFSLHVMEKTLSPLSSCQLTVTISIFICNCFRVNTCMFMLKFHHVSVYSILNYFTDIRWENNIYIWKIWPWQGSIPNSAKNLWSKEFTHTILLLSIKNIMSQSYELVGYKYYDKPFL